MRMILCCGDQGLLTYDGRWHALSCPLASPSLIAADGGVLTAADTAHSQLWHAGRVTPISRGAEALLTDGSRALILSGETDCLAMHDLRTGQMLITSPMGTEPQDLCRISPRLLAVCGGADGMLRLVDPIELRISGCIRLTGCVQRAAWSSGMLFALCAVYSHAMHCLLFSSNLVGRTSCLLELPGLPGALCADGMGGVWAASSETLIHISGLTRRIDREIRGTGLIRHMQCSRGQLLTSDPVLGVCRLYAPDGRVITERHGNVGQALLLSP